MSPQYCCGGAVSFCLSRLSSERRKMLLGSCADDLSEKARNFPSGDQETLVPQPVSGVSSRVINLRSSPPSAETVKISILSEERTNAMRRPSGDQAGKESLAGPLVSCNGFPASMNLV